MTILEAAAALRARKISSVELVEESLLRIARLNPSVNAFITVLNQPARSRAAAMDDELARGMDRGPLHGIPIAHKDLMLTKGVRTTGGSKIFAGFVPDHDADVVTKLNDAGAVMVGKTGLHELAYGITSNNPHYGAIRNPWDTDRIPGGSSGGSGAAVAAGMVPMATGTDTGGSIRLPASYCGVVGLKPTYDRTSRRGVIPLAFSLDHIGPLARTVRDAAVSFQAMLDKTRCGDTTGGAAASGKIEPEISSGYVPPPVVDIRGLRIGLPENYFFDRLDPEVAGAVRKAVQTAAALGARIVNVKVPDMDAVDVVGRVILLVEAVSHLRPYLDRRADFGTDVLALLDQGRLISAADYLDAQRLRRILAREFAGLWTQVDCILTPMTPITAPRIGQTEIQLGSSQLGTPAGGTRRGVLAGDREDTRLASTRFSRSINVLGIPALALPCGLTEARMPIGLQLLAAPRREDLLFRVGAAIEDATGFGRDAPGIAS